MLSDTGEQLVRLESAQEKSEQEIESLDKLLLALKELESAQKKLETAQEEVRILNHEASDAAETARELRTQFNLEQAGIMAEALEDGKPCPVCGSTSHPQKAKKSDCAPTEAEVKAAEDAALAAQKRANLASANTGELLGKRNEKQSTAESLVKDHLQTVELSSAQAVAEIKKSELHGQVDAIKIQIDILAKQKIRKAALEDTIIPGKQGELGKASEAVSASEKELQDLNRQLAVEQERIDSLQKQLTFSSKEEAAEELKRIREKVISIENQIESAEKALNESKVKEAELSGTIKALAERLSGAEEADLKALEEENTELNARKEARNRELQRVQVARSVNESLHQKIGSTIAKLGDLQGKLTWMKSLSDTANGKLVGKDNILLETYVQMTYFDRIISRANVHLSRMSSGKYDLKRHIPTSEDKTGNAQIGLDLDVVDHYNGSERSVKTLSGGETFIASLSLALGLSEEIQASAGGIQLDTMFVDEGFGSLDEDTLNQAMSALTSLSDGHRLIGIISHVAELKSRIEKQIIVKKERSGGSSATIVLGS